MKPGYQTTEFWLVLGAGVTSTVLTHFQAVDGTVGIAVTGILTALYTVLRASLKNKAAGQ